MSQIVKATCIVAIKVECRSSWAPETTMSQIIQQAQEDAKNRIISLFRDAESPDPKLSVKRHPSNDVELIEIKETKIQAFDR